MYIRTGISITYTFFFFSSGEHTGSEVGINLDRRNAQNSMTTDPRLVWPQGKVTFQLDKSIGEVKRVYQGQ